VRIADYLQKQCGTLDFIDDASATWEVFKKAKTLHSHWIDENKHKIHSKFSPNNTDFLLCYVLVKQQMVIIYATPLFIFTSQNSVRDIYSIWSQSWSTLLVLLTDCGFQNSPFNPSAGIIFKKRIYSATILVWNYL